MTSKTTSKHNWDKAFRRMAREAKASESKQTVTLFVLSIHKDGLRRLWPEALSERTARAAAAELAQDGFTCRIIKMELNRDQLKAIQGEKAVLTIRPMENNPFEALRKELDGDE